MPRRTGAVMALRAVGDERRRVGLLAAAGDLHGDLAGLAQVTRPTLIRPLPRSARARSVTGRRGEGRSHDGTSPRRRRRSTGRTGQRCGRRPDRRVEREVVVPGVGSRDEQMPPEVFRRQRLAGGQQIALERHRRLCSSAVAWTSARPTHRPTRPARRRRSFRSRTPRSASAARGRRTGPPRPCSPRSRSSRASTRSCSRSRSRGCRPRTQLITRLVAGDACPADGALTPRHGLAGGVDPRVEHRFAVGVHGGEGRDRRRVCGGRGRDQQANAEPEHGAHSARSVSVREPLPST